MELLQGRLAKSVMDRVCREGDGLFPAPGEIKLACSCPDGAYMCKHVAATLYGVGARLDEAPQLLFALRGVDEGDLLAGAEQGAMASKAAPDSRMVLAGGDMSALFGLDMADASEAPVVAAAKPARKKDNAPPTKRAAPPRNEQPLKSASARKGKAAKAAAGRKRAGKR